MAVDIRRYRFRRSFFHRKSTLYRLSVFEEARAFFGRMGIRIDAVSYSGFAFTGQMLAVGDRYPQILVSDFEVGGSRRRPVIRFRTQGVEIIHGRVIGTGDVVYRVTYDGFEGVEAAQ